MIETLLVLTTDKINGEKLLKDKVHFAAELSYIFRILSGTFQDQNVTFNQI
jgi:hypothetical protein